MSKLCSAVVPFVLFAAFAPAQVTATYATFGAGCPGTGTGLGATHVLPAVANSAWGSGNAIPLGWSPNKFQQFFAGAELPTAFTMAALSLRQPHTGAQAPGFQVDLEIAVGYTTRWQGTISSTFATNWDVAPPVVVLPRTVVTFPDQHTYPQSFTEMVITIPWPVTFDWVPAAGQNLLVEITVYGNSAGSGIYGYPLDNLGGTIGQWGTPATATTANGGPPRTFGPVMGFVELTHTAVPLLYSTGTPQIGNTFRVRVAQCAAGVPVFLMFGWSNGWSHGYALPYSLLPYGAPACAVLVDAMDTRVLTANAIGYTSLNYSIPNNIYALGLPFYNQAFAFDLGANALGLSVSNGGQGVMGNQ